MNVRECRLSDKMQELLNQQLKDELYNHNLYKTMENFFEVEGIDDLKEYYRKRAAEELEHFGWVFSYMGYQDAFIDIPPIEKIKQSVSETIKIFEDTVDVEIKTTASIKRIYDQAVLEGDGFTRIWLDEKLYKEQTEEESTSRTALDIIKLKDTPILERARKILALLD
jgi:ferritin